jgi:succinate dehydrogenase / fumarate reductase membrane anchor subunit
MLTSKSGPKPGESAGLWMIKLLTGFLIIIILGIHLTVNHMLGSANGLLTQQEVVEYYSKWIVPFMEILFLVFVVSHSLIGTRSIILDLNPSKSILKALDWLFIIIGSGYIIYGIWLVIKIVQLGS